MMKTWLLNRLKEKTTWIGITGVISTAGFVLSPEQAELIAAIGISIVSLILTFTKEQKPQ